VLAMLVLFPMTSGHQFEAHVRTPEARRSIERHVFVAHSYDSTSERVARVAAQPTAPAPTVKADIDRPLEPVEEISQIPLTLLLPRLKVASASSRNPDPLL